MARFITFIEVIFPHATIDGCLRRGVVCAKHLHLHKVALTAIPEFSFEEPPRPHPPMDCPVL